MGAYMYNHREKRSNKTGRQYGHCLNQGLYHIIICPQKCV